MGLDVTPGIMGGDAQHPTPNTERPTLRVETSEKRKPIARTLLAEVTLVIGLSDEDGEPQGPYNGQKVTLARLDPEGRGRDLDEQFRDLLAKAEAQVVEMWEKRNAG